jgi:hypothetical protein
MTLLAASGQFFVTLKTLAIFTISLKTKLSLSPNPPWSNPSFLSFPQHPHLLQLSQQLPRKVLLL